MLEGGNGTGGPVGRSARARLLLMVGRPLGLLALVAALHTVAACASPRVFGTFNNGGAQSESQRRGRSSRFALTLRLRACCS
jgi:hypothetical protein